MKYTYRLAGENLELAEAELNGFLKSQKIDEEASRNGRLAETESEPEQLKRLALTHEVCKKMGETSTENIEIDTEVKESFAVRCKVLEGEKDSKNLEEKIGRELSSGENSVDLENPETEIYAYVQSEKVIVGELVQDINRGLFQKRSNEKRPFSSPVSLDPVLARVLVNVSRTPPGGKILDPFCGTGGILIEAGLCGIMPFGTDTKEEMVKGTRENLEEYGIINHEIRQTDAGESLELFEPDAIITDLPYGKASNVEGKVKEKMLELMENFSGSIVFMYDKPHFGELEADFQIYIHKNLTRYVFIEV